MPSDDSSSDYLADSEASDSFETDHPPSTMKSSLKQSKARRVTVRSPSEEELYAQNLQFEKHRRPSTPYSSTRHHSLGDENSNKPREARDQKNPVTADSSTTTQPGVQPYNNPTGSAAPLGPNQVFTHGTHGQFGAQPFAYPAAPNAPYFYTVNFAGQPTPIFIANNGTSAPGNPTTMEGYQNSSQPSNGVHFQPPVPDTSLGPMTHHYVPQFSPQVASGVPGGAFFLQPGIAAPHGVGVPIQTGPVAGMPIMQQPQMQPVMIAGGPPQAGYPMMPMAGGVGGGVPPGQPVLVNGGPAPMMPGNFPVYNEPATGIGLTSAQVAASCMSNPQLNMPQDFKPGDDDPSRMYMVRQLDGEYIQMSRATIDSFGSKGARWYCTDDGVFYAVRLEQ